MGKDRPITVLPGWPAREQPGEDWAGRNPPPELRGISRIRRIFTRGRREGGAGAGGSLHDNDRASNSHDPAFKQFTQPTTTGIIHYISQQSYDEEDGDKLSEREGQRLTFQALFGKARNPLRHARRNQQSCLVVYSISLVTTGYIVSLAVGWPFSVGRFPAASIRSDQPAAPTGTAFLCGDRAFESSGI